MTHLEWWKLGADILLLGALGWLSFVLVRSKGAVAVPSRQGIELERTLRGLIKEADLASSSLQDQLLRRQQSLEKVLRDLEATESRVSRAAANAETRAQGAGTASIPATEVASSAPNSRPVQRNEDFEAPSFNAVAPRSGRPAKAAPERPHTNIYGEVIEPSISAAPPAPAPAVKPTSLAAAIEREVIPARRQVVEARGNPAESLSEVRRAAEELLRAGRDLEFVARRTNLSIDEVRLLSNAVLRDSSMKKTTSASPIVEDEVTLEGGIMTADPRLGVLSPIRRSIETV